MLNQESNKNTTSAHCAYDSDVHVINILRLKLTESLSSGANIYWGQTD